MSVLFAALAMLTFVYFKDREWWMLFGMEVIWVLGIVYAFVVYKKIFKPIALLQQGINALKDEDFNVKFRSSNSSDIDELVQVYNAMIDKIRNERVYQEEQHYFLNQLIDAMPVGVIILDYDHLISEFNPQAKKMFDLNESDLSIPLKDIQHKIGQELDALKIGASAVIKMDSIHYYRCTVNRFIYKGFPRIFILIEEISNEILENEKQAYGKVIRMMSHEVNNSIGAINSILDSLLTIEPLSIKEVKEYLPIVMERNVHLADFMKNFAKVIRLPQPKKKPEDVHAILFDVVQLMRRTMEENGIEIEMDFDPETLVRDVDRSQLEQAFINILKNAIEAIESDGKIGIYATSKSIIIEDNGCGIEEGKKDQLFTPFFSTKPTGQGVGLTLIKEILYNHGWKFNLTSSDGKTQFQIYY